MTGASLIRHSSHGIFFDDPPYLDRETLALIRKITAAGYRTREDGRVLYNNTEWLTPQDWCKRMGLGVIV